MLTGSPQWSRELKADCSSHLLDSGAPPACRCKGACAILVVAAIVAFGLVAPYLPKFDWLKEFFARASTESQTVILIVTVLFVIVSCVVAVLQHQLLAQTEDDLAASEQDNLAHQVRLNLMLDVNRGPAFGGSRVRPSCRRSSRRGNGRPGSSRSST